MKQNSRRDHRGSLLHNSQKSTEAATCNTKAPQSMTILFLTHTRLEALKVLSWQLLNDFPKHITLLTLCPTSWTLLRNSSGQPRSHNFKNLANVIRSLWIRASRPSETSTMRRASYSVKQILGLTRQIGTSTTETYERSSTSMRNNRNEGLQLGVFDRKARNNERWVRVQRPTVLTNLTSIESKRSCNCLSSSFKSSNVFSTFNTITRNSSTVSSASCASVAITNCQSSAVIYQLTVNRILLSFSMELVGGKGGVILRDQIGVLGFT